MEEALEAIGLTKSEAKVYLSLIKLGATSTGPLVKHSGVASSKIYGLLDKLMDKGLVTTFKESKIRYFKAVDPKRLKDYIKIKREELNLRERKIKEIMPALEDAYKEKLEETEVEIFRGQRGLNTAFKELLGRLRKGDELLVIGGKDIPTLSGESKLFLQNFHRKRSARGIKLRILLSESRRKVMRDITKMPHTTSKYLQHKTHSPINIYKDITLLVNLSPTITVIRIRDKHIAESYRIYFEEMWKAANR